MDLLEKMRGFLRKKPSKAELERIDKKKVEADRARMEDLRARLESAGVFAPSAPMTDEERATVRAYFREACAQAKDVMATSFKVEEIDRHTADTVSILERAMKEGGSYKTILRCFQGIAYGIQNAHEPIPEHAIETDVVARRENTAAQYFHLAQMSLEIDRIRRDVDRKQDQKRQRATPRSWPACRDAPWISRRISIRSTC